MGVTKVTWDSLHEVDFAGKKMVELGDQKIFFPEPLRLFDTEIVFLKNYFDILGIQHVSIDWHGNNGALRLDFSKPVPTLMRGVYDIVTNFGFTEHVHDQYAAWRNVDSLIKVGGLIVSELPGMPNFPDHGHLPFYTTKFFTDLAEKAGYEIITNRYQQHTFPSAGQVVFSCLKKTKEGFIDEGEFNEIFLSK